jgi:hypothetical protein
MKRYTTVSKISSAQHDTARTKLRLSRETLRQLTTRELTAVAGGDEYGDTRPCTTTTTNASG